MQLQFFRLRFHFEAVDPALFPAGTAANTLRGALGSILRSIACAPPCDGIHHDTECAYARIFEPRGGRNGPSGFSQRPRPFVLRAHHLDGRSFDTGECFHFDIHWFDLTAPLLPHVIQAFTRLADEGLGAGRQRTRLKQVEQLALGDEEGRDAGMSVPKLEPCSVALEPDRMPVTVARVRFVTPTELKCRETVAARPDFPVLFARIRDRISSLRAFYGPGPLEIDFRAMAERASCIQMTRCELREERAERRSSRTGQVHSLGGFTGEAEYHGDLAEFLPYLRAARWTGVGRQTVWGKGELHVRPFSDCSHA
ncbi:MAG TPA: CRISPR system precrRNA processing endoribonuclease RAMP protein Cas6 [Bryobacteraceae bacterium]|nr:CRISPR system precrRNA processing endoribonuclease RAMP protein Cas6 [Bryobacteraceae bacterium]